MDPISGKSNIRLVDMTVPTKNLLATIKSCKAGGDDASLVQNLADLIDKCISIDPTKRATVIETLKHPFFATSK
jgi:serine/threonine-protein kinase PRP4